jgi:hypothetical protein
MTHYKPKIPVARAILKQALHDHNDMNYKLRDAIETALELMYRSSPNRRAPNSSTKMTITHRDAIKHYAKINPAASVTEMATRFNVNAGRISEVIAGQWDYLDDELS